MSGVDGRSAAARRFRDILAEVIGDLGGDAYVSEGQRQLARRAAAMSVQAETMEARMAQGEALDVEEYVKLVNGLNRTFASIGLRRHQRNVSEPGLHDVLSGGASA